MQEKFKGQDSTKKDRDLSHGNFFHSIRKNREIPKDPTLILHTLAGYLDVTGDFREERYCSQETLRLDTRMSLNTVKKSLKWLSDNGYLIIRGEPGQTNYYRITDKAFGHPGATRLPTQAPRAYPLGATRLPTQAPRAYPPRRHAPTSSIQLLDANIITNNVCETRACAYDPEHTHIDNVNLSYDEKIRKLSVEWILNDNGKGTYLKRESIDRYADGLCRRFGYDTVLASFEDYQKQTGEALFTYDAQFINMTVQNYAQFHPQDLLE